MRGRQYSFSAASRDWVVKWWAKNVRKRGGNKYRGGMSVRQAQIVLGVTQQSVSRWMRAKS